METRSRGVAAVVLLDEAVGVDLGTELPVAFAAVLAVFVAGFGVGALGLGDGVFETVFDIVDTP